MSPFKNPFPEAGVPEYPPAIPMVHTKYGDTIHNLKVNFSSKIMNFLSDDNFPVNVLFVLGSYGSGKTKLFYNSIYELYHPNETLAMGDQSLILADAESTEQREEMSGILNRKKILAVYLTFESAFMRKHTLNHVVSILRSALEELVDPTHDPNRLETQKIPEKFKARLGTSKIDTLGAKDILELLGMYFSKIVIFVDEFERIAQRAVGEQNAIIESLRDDFIDLFSNSKYGTLIIISYTPAIEYLIPPAVERRGRFFETGRFSLLTAKEVLQRYLAETDFTNFFQEDTIFSAFHLARDAGSQFLQICGESLTRACRRGNTRILFDDILHAIRIIQGPEGQKLFSEAYCGTLLERLGSLDQEFPRIFNYVLGSYYPRSGKEIAEGAGVKVEKVNKFITKFSSKSELFTGLSSPLLIKCYLLDKASFQVEKFSKERSLGVNDLIDNLSKLLEVSYNGRQMYIIPHDSSDFYLRIGVGLSGEVHKALLEISEQTDKVILSTEVLNHLIASPVGYEDILELVKGKLREEVRTYLTKRRSTYEKEKEAEVSLCAIWEQEEREI